MEKMEGVETTERGTETDAPEDSQEIQGRSQGGGRIRREKAAMADNELQSNLVENSLFVTPFKINRGVTVVLLSNPESICGAKVLTVGRFFSSFSVWQRTHQLLSPHLTSLHLTSPLLSSPPRPRRSSPLFAARRSSPLLSSPLLSSPLLSSPLLSSPLLASLLLLLLAVVVVLLHSTFNAKKTQTSLKQRFQFLSSILPLDCSMFSFSFSVFCHKMVFLFEKSRTCSRLMNCDTVTSSCTKQVCIEARHAHIPLLSSTSPHLTSPHSCFLILSDLLNNKREIRRQLSVKSHSISICEKHFWTAQASTP